MSSSIQISRASTVNDVLRDYPATASVFNFFGIDTCCGGGATVSQAAETEGINAGAVVAALRNAARQSLVQPA